MRSTRRGGRRGMAWESLEPRRCLTTAFIVADVDCCAAGNVSAVGSADLDGDGDIDLISATRDAGTGWYRNLDGQGNFGVRSTISASLAEQAAWIDAADLDGDGDLDIVAASLEAGELFWYRNLDGAGNFGEKMLATPTLIGGISIDLADVDGDNDVDLVWSSVTQNAVVWNSNNGDGTFGAPRLVASGFAEAQDTLVADLDGDGRMDVAVASQDFLNPRVAWYQNLGGGLFGGEKLATSDGNAVWSVDAGDVDGDGDLDLVTSVYDFLTGEQMITWAENTDGRGEFGPQQTLMESTIYPMDIGLTDVDGDSDMDVVAVPLVGNGQPILISNAGGGAFGAPELLPVQRALKFTLADFNGDGAIDLATDSVAGLVWAAATEDRVIGDSNGDGIFNSSDFVVVFSAGRYETGLPATFEQGDWNGDGQFNTADLVTAFTAGGYLESATVAALSADLNDAELATAEFPRRLTGARPVRTSSHHDAELSAAVDWLLARDRARWL